MHEFRLKQIDAFGGSAKCLREDDSFKLYQTNQHIFYTDSLLSPSIGGIKKQFFTNSYKHYMGG